MFSGFTGFGAGAGAQSPKPTPLSGPAFGSNGTGFGTVVSSGFGERSNTGFGTASSNNAGFGSSTNSGFGSNTGGNSNIQTGFGGNSNTFVGGVGGFGVSNTGNNNTGFSNNPKSSISSNPTFASPANPAFGTTGTGGTTGFGANSNMFGSTLNSTHKPLFGSGANFGQTSSASPAGNFGASNASVGFSNTNNQASAFGPAGFGAINNNNFGAQKAGTALGSFGTSNTYGSTGASGGFGQSNLGINSSTTGIGANNVSVGNYNGNLEQQTLNQQQLRLQLAAAQEILDKNYKDLPQMYQQEISRTVTEFIIPTRTMLLELSNHRGHLFSALEAELKKIILAVIKLEAEQSRLQSELKPFVEESKELSHTVRSSAILGLQQIHSRNQIGISAPRELDENLPGKFYIQVLERIERRLNASVADVRYFEQQLRSKVTALQQQANKGISNRGAYNQLVRIGPRQILELIQQQNAAFLKIAANVAGVHGEVDSLRVLFLQTYSKENQNKERQSEKVDDTIDILTGKSCREGFSSSIESNGISIYSGIHTGTLGSSSMMSPFEIADKREATEKRLQAQKLRGEVVQHQQQQQQPQSSQVQSFSNPFSGTQQIPSLTGSVGSGGFNLAGNAIGTGASTTVGTSSNSNFAALDLATNKNSSSGFGSSGSFSTNQAPAFNTPFGATASPSGFPAGGQFNFGGGQLASSSSLSSLTNKKSNKTRK